jgi:universal stress protein E
MKASEGHAFLLGLFSNTDWDLLRESPLPVWFVADDEAAGGPANGVIAAVDQYFPDDEDECESFQLDNEAFNTAKRLSDRYAASLYAVHAYQVPRMLPGFEGYTPMLGPSSAATATAADLALTCHDRAAIARRHGQVVQDFVDEHGIPVDDLIVKEGEVWQVLSEAAESRGAGLIVMGSSKKSWWDRLRGRSNAEPTLSRSSCDVLFVKADAESQ